jgi:hypothetical protein
MSAQKPHDTGGAYEKTDALFGPTFRAGLYILGVMFLTAAIVVPLYRFFLRGEEASQRPAATVLRDGAKAPEPPGPRLVVSEPLALAEFRAQEDALLTSYGWVEKDRGIARIPIDEAMRIVAERGMPVFPAAEAPPAAPVKEGAR